MHICFTLSSLSCGGAERVAATLSNYFVSQGHKVTLVLVSIDHNNTFYKLDENIDVIPLIKTKKDKKPLRRIKILKNKLLEINPDVVISFLPHICIYAYLALRHTKIPFICSERNDPNKYSSFRKVLLKKAFKSANGCVFQTKDSKQFYKSVSNDKSIIIRNPVNLTVDPNKTKGEPKEKVFISVGRLTPQKNFSFLISTFQKYYAKHADYKLIIYGEGPLRNELENQIASLGLKDVVLLPGTNDSWHEVAINSTGFISTSNYEGMPNCLEEALCLGCPSIATDCPIGGSKDLINLLNSGILIKMNNEEELLDAMNNIIDGKYDGKVVDYSPLIIENIAIEWLSFIKKIIN